MEKDIDRQLILKIATTKTLVSNEKMHESKLNLNTSKKIKGINMKSEPLFYVCHASGKKQVDDKNGKGFFIS